MSLNNLINKDSDLQRCECPSLDELFQTSGRYVQPLPSWSGLSLNMGQNVPSKCREPNTQLHIPEDSNTAVRTTSNLTTLPFILQFSECITMFTDSTHQNPIENRFPSACQIIPRVLWKPSIEYRVRKNITPVPQFKKIFPFPFTLLVFIPKTPCKSKGPVWHFVKFLLFTVRSCYSLAQIPSWMTTTCRLSAIVYLVYSQLPSKPSPSPGAWGHVMPW